MRSFLSIIILSFVFNCQKEFRPAAVPEAARYDKKTNLYILNRDGFQKSWFSTGELYSECKVNQFGARNGLCKYYSQKGVMISQGNFKEEQRDGIWVWHFANGGIYYKQNFTYGKRKEFWIPILEWGNEDGIYERYYASGNIEETGYYVSGEKDGLWVKYFQNGKKEYGGKYANGKKINLWQYYFPDGKPEAEEVYAANGILLKRISYTNGKVRCEEIPAAHILRCNG